MAFVACYCCDLHLTFVPMVVTISLLLYLLRLGLLRLCLLTISHFKLRNTKSKEDNKANSHALMTRNVTFTYLYFIFIWIRRAQLWR